MGTGVMVAMRGRAVLVVEEATDTAAEPGVGVGTDGMAVWAAMAARVTAAELVARGEMPVMEAERGMAATGIMVAVVAGAEAALEEGWAETEAMAITGKSGAMDATHMMDKGVRMRLVS